MSRCMGYNPASYYAQQASRSSYSYRRSSSYRPSYSSSRRTKTSGYNPSSYYKSQAQKAKKSSYSYSSYKKPKSSYKPSYSSSSYKPSYSSSKKSTYTGYNPSSYYKSQAQKAKKSSYSSSSYKKSTSSYKPSYSSSSYKKPTSSYKSSYSYSSSYKPSYSSPKKTTSSYNPSSYYKSQAQKAQKTSYSSSSYKKPTSSYKPSYSSSYSTSNKSSSIEAQAAKIAHVSVGSSGTPNINNASDAKAYQKALASLTKGSTGTSSSNSNSSKTTYSSTKKTTSGYNPSSYYKSQAEKAQNISYSSSSYTSYSSNKSSSIEEQAAHKAHISVGSSGTPNINSASDAKAYQKELEKLSNNFSTTPTTTKTSVTVSEQVKDNVTEVAKDVNVQATTEKKITVPAYKAASNNTTDTTIQAVAEKEHTSTLMKIAATVAGISYDDNGTPKINSASDAIAFSKVLNGHFEDESTVQKAAAKVLGLQTNSNGTILVDKSKQDNQALQAMIDSLKNMGYDEEVKTKVEDKSKDSGFTPFNQKTTDNKIATYLKNPSILKTAGFRDESLKVNLDGTVTLNSNFALELGKGPINTTMSTSKFKEYCENYSKQTAQTWEQGSDNPVYITKDKTLIDSIVDAENAAWEGTKDVANDVWDGTKDVASDVWNGTKNVASDVWDGTKDVASDVWNGTKNVASDTWDAITNKALETIDLASPIIQNNGSILNLVETDFLETMLPNIATNNAKANYILNKQNDITNGFIYGQKNNNVKDMNFGHAKIAHTGCEIVATYNAMQLTGNSVSFADTIYEYEENGAQMLFGHFGSNPDGISDYLDNHNVNYTQASSASELEQLTQQNGSVAILSFWNYEGAITGGLHTVAIQRNGSNYDVYNYGGYDTAPTNSWDKYVFSNVDNIINEGKFFTGYKFD
ncbi:MAG: hypothetical protein ACPKOI_09325 [Pleomorphochaeta sp.]